MKTKVTGQAISHAPVVLDIAGTTLNADDRRRLAHPLTGGLILFARNWQHRQQLTELCAEVKTLRPDVLICVDHEGGRVQRFRTDASRTCRRCVLGEMWMRDGKSGEGSGAMTATTPPPRPAMCSAPNCGPAVSTSASRPCSTSTGVAAA